MKPDLRNEKNFPLFSFDHLDIDPRMCEIHFIFSILNFFPGLSLTNDFIENICLKSEPINKLFKDGNNEYKKKGSLTENDRKIIDFFGNVSLSLLIYYSSHLLYPVEDNYNYHFLKNFLEKLLYPSNQELHFVDPNIFFKTQNELKKDYIDKSNKNIINYSNFNNSSFRKRDFDLPSENSIIQIQENIIIEKEYENVRPLVKMFNKRLIEFIREIEMTKKLANELERELESFNYCTKRALMFLVTRIIQCYKKQ